MEDKTKTTGGDEPTTFTQEQVEAMKKELESNYEKWVQKIIGQKKAYDEVFNHLDSISEDPTKLIKLYEEKPEVAKIILDKYYDGKSIESFKEDSWYKPDLTDPNEIQKLIDRWVESKVQAKLIDEKKNAFIKELKLSNEELEKFNEAFDERKQLKTFNVSNLEKVLEKSYRDIDANTEALKDYKKTVAIANVMANWWKQSGNGSKDKKTSFEKAKTDTRSFLDKHL